MAFVQSDAVEVRQAEGKGRGVFALRPIRKGEEIERVPVLVMGADEYARGVDQTLLAGYVFAWGEGQIALALGYGSLYNHSYKPNAKYEDEEEQAKRFVALRDIKAGEEVTVNYNGSPTGRAKMWFDVAKEAKKPRVARRVDPKGEITT
jgi:SET domain-containing protein